MDITNHIIELKQAQFIWPGAKNATINIPQLCIAHGEHVFIKGPSGCGKSTLLGLLTGVNTLTSGALSILDTNIAALKAHQRDAFRADHVGYIFQQFNLLPYLTVVENVLLPCQFSARRHQRASAENTQSVTAEATSLLERLHLPTTLHHQSVSTLSIGQQQRVAVARALMGKPELIIADEPTSALDHDNRQAFIELLMEQAKRVNATLIFVSHDPTLEPLFHRSIHLPSINQITQQEGAW